MENGFVTKATQRRVSMYNLNLFAYNNIPEDWKEGEDRRHRRLAINDEKGYMVDLQSICEITDARSALISVCDDNHFMAPIDELRRQLINVAFYSTRLREEEVTGHAMSTS